MKGFTVSRSINLNCDKEKLLSFLWNMENLEQYEPKVTKVLVAPEKNGSGTYLASGKFGLTSWRGRFSYQKNATGFTSKTIKPIVGNSISGGFVVKANESSKKMILSHWEHYELMLSLKPLTPLVKIFLSFSINRELKNIARMLEVYHYEGV